jgi:CRP-like cAMP-binding protein
MRDTRHVRVSRELFLTAFGAELGQVDSRIIDRLTYLLEEEDVFAGETLFAAGAPPEYFYFLREGRMRLVREGSAAQSVRGPAVVGMFDAVLDRPRLRTAVVLEDTQLMRVPVDAWVELLEDSFELTRASVLGSARQVALLEERLLDAGVVPWTGSTGGASLAAGVRLRALERLALLMHALPLRLAGVQTLSDLALASEEVAFAPNDVVFEPSAKRERVFLVVEGRVAASRGPSDIVWTFHPGQIVCGAAAFGGAPATWSARAMSPVRALAFRVEDWFDLMEEHFDLVRSALAGLVLERERLLDLTASIAAPSTPSLHEEGSFPGQRSRVLLE